MHVVSEATVRRFSTKWVFLEIVQNSQEKHMPESLVLKFHFPFILTYERRVSIQWRTAIQ